ncbi:hypothetical protein CDD82_4769 [Ophiocordyceps australis]|uniref:3-hydroxyisobutyryl-CoA hydrolase n=1 Tax=Ophiocordyceps australis TaxID=1399860 RepID=A0A2C5ZSI8_9HYPO|nr:hypothetical protein CDD82_4769 [Ophiocordyceps australis]
MSRKISTEASSLRELPDDKPDDVVFDSRYGFRSIILNRPGKYNSLNASMIRKIVPRLVQWEKSDMANVIVIKGAGQKAFCAGGDVVELARLNDKEGGWKKSAEYFALEYKLDHYIATYSKPLIAFMDGITMGGGVGLSIHAPFRIATERTVFAMPETTIGFFPDVGATFFLPRLNGYVGTCLALTSDRLTGPNVFYAGIATHYIHSTTLPDLEARLAELKFSDSDSLRTRLDIINNTLEEFATGLPFDIPMKMAGEVRRAIDRCYSRDSVSDIIAALEEEQKGDMAKWASEQLKMLKEKSPTSLHVTLRQMRDGSKWDIAEVFQKEYQLANKFMKHPDFSEGVKARLVRKTPPIWKPDSLKNLPSNADLAGPFFEFDNDLKIELFTPNTYSDYPYAALGVPTEKEIKELILTRAFTPRELVKALHDSRKGRQGIAEVVQEIVARMTIVDSDGNVRWTEDEAAPDSKL